MSSAAKMTVETTSFLSGGKIASNGSEKSAKILNNHKNLIILLLVTILVVFCAGVSVLQVTLLNRMSAMQSEIDELKQRPSAAVSPHTNSVNSLIQEMGQLKLRVDHQGVAIDTIKRNITDLRLNIAFEEDLLDDLEDFDRKYDQQGDSSKELSADKTKFDDVGEDDEDEETFDDEDDEDVEDDTHSGYGDDIPDSEDDQYDYGAEEEYSETTPAPKEGETDDNNIYKDMKRARNSRRNPRSILGLTEQGVPILNEPYSQRKNQTANGDSEQAATRGPKLTKYQWSEHRRHSGGSPRREHYTQHRLHHHQRPRQDFAFAAAPVQHNFIGYGNRFNGTSTTSTIAPASASTQPTAPAPMQSRRSRVMHFEDKTAAFKQVVTKDELARMQEMRQLPEGFSSSPATRQHHHQQQISTRRRMLPLRKGFELKNASPQHRITAVHYEGDFKMNIAGSHRHHDGGRITMDGNLIQHWRPADWTSTHGMSRFFSMDKGALTVNDHGLFLIYAQVSYADKGDINGFYIGLNENTHENVEHKKLFQCNTMTQTHPDNHKLKVNSCYTSGVINLNVGDQIRIKNIGYHRNVTMQPSRTFFGLVKINMHPLHHNAEAESLEI